MKLTDNPPSVYAICILKKYAIFFCLIAVVLILSIISPVFLTWTNITNILSQNTYLIIASIGVSMVMISGGIDISVSYQISLVGAVTTILIKWVGLSIPLAIIAGLITGLFLGLINGFATIKLNVHPMITTFGTMAVFQGVSYVLFRSKAIFDLPDTFKFIGQGYVRGIPFSVLIMAAAALLASFILNKTYYGKYLYAIGSSDEAGRLVGINVNAMKVAVFSICGFFVAVSAIVLVSRTGSASSSMAVGTEFSCITAAVLGGVSLKGGEGKIWGVITGALILGALVNGMQLLGLSINTQYIAKGILLIAAIGIDTYQKKMRLEKSQQ